MIILLTFQVFLTNGKLQWERKNIKIFTDFLTWPDWHYLDLGQTNSVDLAGTENFNKSRLLLFGQKDEESKTILQEEVKDFSIAANSDHPSNEQGEDDVQISGSGISQR